MVYCFLGGILGHTPVFAWVQREAKEENPQIGRYPKRRHTQIGVSEKWAEILVFCFLLGWLKRKNKGKQTKNRVLRLRVSFFGDSNLSGRFDGVHL